MEIIPSVFQDADEEPTHKDVERELGRSLKHWDGLKDHIEQEYGPVTVGWGYWKKAGWGCRYAVKKRRVVYLMPCAKHFMASFILGGKAIEAMKQSGEMTDEIAGLLDEAPKYPEGSLIRFPVRTAKDFKITQTLTRFKMGK